MQCCRSGAYKLTVRVRVLDRFVRLSLAILAMASALEGSDPQTGPYLPEDPLDYAGIVVPDYYRSSNFPGGRQNRVSATDFDNTPASNTITNEGATLGRILFYDKSLSANGTISCSSCHLQGHGFTDPETLSRGFDGGLTRRHSMGLTNARYYRAGKFFWDERAMTLEDQVLMPFHDSVEMGLTLEQLESLVRSQPYYSNLFDAAFGSQTIDSDRISRALAQFVRSIVGFDSKYDRGRSQVASPLTNFPNFSAQENQGKRIFMTNGGVGRTPCTVCHQSESFSLVAPGGNRNQVTGASNNGLDAFSIADRGVAETTNNGQDTGEFKSPSLRNVSVGAPYMHDGRFATLEQVIDHYSTGIQAHPNLAGALRENNRTPEQYNFSTSEKAALIAFLNTLTDDTLLSDEKFSDPFINPDVPTITEVVNSANTHSAIADQTWVTIVGRNLAESTMVSAGLPSGSTGIPDSLGGVSVTVNAARARVGSVSPTRILVLAPTDTVLGDVEVQVTNEQGSTNVMTIAKQEVAPALFRFGSAAASDAEDWQPPGLDLFETDSSVSRYAAAVYSDGSRAVRSGTFQGPATNAARPGDEITIFGTGFGPTLPAVADGRAINSPLPLATSVTVWFDGVQAAVGFAGMVAPGLYRFDVVVPAVAAGDLHVTAEVAGIQSEGEVYVTVQQ